MAYPLSSDVSSGQPTAYQHYNNLRADALYLGQAAADVVSLGAFFQRYADNIKIEYLATNRLRVPHVASRPATMMINGLMLQAAANVDLPASSFSGGAATWYIFAKQTAGSTTFTLEVNTANAESSSTRLIGEVYWDGANLYTGTIKCYIGNPFPPADYDSGWFSCVYNTLYTKAHGLGQAPRHVILLHSAVSTPASSDELMLVTGAHNSYGAFHNFISLDGTNVYVSTTDHSSYGTCTSGRRLSSSGYYRVQAWR